jgi:vacuolar-type H+-ATPase subunit H
MQFTPSSIREASFVLAASGYNPEEVDQRLGTIADHLAQNGTLETDLLACDFDSVPAGYDPRGVEEFFKTLRDGISKTNDLSDGDADPAVMSGDTSQDEAAEATALEDEVTDTPAVSLTADESGEEAPRETFDVLAAAETPTVRTSLPGAVERTKLAVSELESFAASQVNAAKAALHAQLAETRADCSRTLDTARSISDEALATAREQAESVLQQATEHADELRQNFDAALTSLRRAFDSELAARHEHIRASLDELVRQAQHNTAEAQTQLASIHTHVTTSLNEAQSVLTNATDQLAA